MLDMSLRLDTANLRVVVLWAIFGCLAAPVYGPLALIPLGIGCGFTIGATRLARRLRRPEFVLVGAWAVVTLAISAAMLLAAEGPDIPLAPHGGARFFLLMVFMVPTLAAAISYPVRVVVWGPA